VESKRAKKRRKSAEQKAARQQKQQQQRATNADGEAASTDAKPDEEAVAEEPLATSAPAKKANKNKKANANKDVEGQGTTNDEKKTATATKKKNNAKKNQQQREKEKKENEYVPAIVPTASVEDWKRKWGRLKSWQHFNLHPTLMEAIKEYKFFSPTPIQEKALTVALREDKDVVGVAETVYHHLVRVRVRCVI
jgi:ATP-dependent RNA helicase DDX24/MAK5